MRSDSPEVIAPKAMVYVLTGPVRGGKTTFLRKGVVVWKSRGHRIGGFLSQARMEGKTLIGYDLVDLWESVSIPFLRKEGDSVRQKNGPYFFLPEGLEKARTILFRDRDKDVLIVDEVGPLEMKSRGIWSSLRRAIEADARCLCVVRQGILAEFTEKLKTRAVSVFRFGDPGLLRLMTAEIFGAATGKSTTRGGRRP